MFIIMLKMTMLKMTMITMMTKNYNLKMMIFRICKDLCDDKEDCKIIPSQILNQYSKCDKVLS